MIIDESDPHLPVCTQSGNEIFGVTDSLSVARSWIAIVSAKRDRHRIQIGRIERREVHILDLDHHVEILYLHDPLGANRHRARLRSDSATTDCSSPPPTVSCSASRTLR